MATHDKGHTAVADCRTVDVGFEEGKANAKLIAASPELLAACKMVLAWADSECLPQGSQYDGPWEEIEAAVAKAEGGAV